MTGRQIHRQLGPGPWKCDTRVHHSVSPLHREIVKVTGWIGDHARADRVIRDMVKTGSLSADEDGHGTVTFNKHGWVDPPVDTRSASERMNSTLAAQQAIEHEIRLQGIRAAEAAEVKLNEPARIAAVNALRRALNDIGHTAEMNEIKSRLDRIEAALGITVGSDTDD